MWSGCQESTARKFFGELDDFRPEVFFLISPNVQFPHKQKFVDTSGQSFRLQERKKQQNKKNNKVVASDKSYRDHVATAPSMDSIFAGNASYS